MDRKKYYNLENPRDIQEVMDLIENEDLSDIELGVGSDEENLQEYEMVPISRPGPDILTNMRRSYWKEIIRMYWDKFFGIGIFLENMSRDRFFQLRSCLHLVNNLEKPENCVDKLYKVRPLIDVKRKRCLELQLEEELYVDEQIVPFTGTFAVKQYVKEKPCPWGLKLFILCGKSGYAYDFIFYHGKTTGLNENNLKKYGQGASVVLHLSRRIGTEKGHRLYYDNYFSSYDLLTILKDKQIYAAGTIRTNRFFKPPLMTDREMKKKNRGFSEEIVDEKEENVVVVK
ncbi:hypothetical protein JTB14_017685 [Gonioctena quinquepunctata]|nr:hypothetical protein JTB14_017685 [Gonioctena quinquepunctata]